MPVSTNDREYRLLLDDALEAIERLEKIAHLAADVLDASERRGAKRGDQDTKRHERGVRKVAFDTLSLLRGKIEDLERLLYR